MELFDSLTDLQSSQTTGVISSPTCKFDSLTDLQSSQTHRQSGLLDDVFDSLTDLQSSQTIHFLLAASRRLIPLLIYKALKHHLVSGFQIVCLIPLLIYKALKRRFGRFRFTHV